MEALRQSGNKDATPNLICFNSVLNALAKARSFQGAQRADELLTRMESLSRTNPAYSELKADAVSYSTVVCILHEYRASFIYHSRMHQISAWAATNETESAERAEAVLDRMEQANVEGDIIAYNRVALSWANAGDAAKVEAIYNRMRRMGTKPDYFTYKTLVLAWSQNEGCAAKAQHFLDMMLEKYDTGSISKRPDNFCFRAVASRWQKEGAPERAAELLLAM